MPRKPRFFLPNVPVHIVQKGQSNERVFFEDRDFQAYLAWLAEGAKRYDCAIHAYSLMANHIHILATPKATQGVSRMMQFVSGSYVSYINQLCGTSGSIWEGRYKASLIDVKQYLLTCMSYIESNPVRAGETRNPAQYRWSSYRANAQGKVDSLITPHPVYLKLGATTEERLVAYKKIYRARIDEDQLRSIRNAWQTGTPLGSDEFKATVERKLNVKVGQDRRGRPRKSLAS